MAESFAGPKKPATARRRSRPAAARPRQPEPISVSEGVGGLVTDRFFRQLVTGMRNGVLAMTRDGRLAAMNQVAYRVLGLTPRPDDIGRSIADVVHAHPELVRILGRAFELGHLPNRAELRLKGPGKVIGYTLSHVLDEEGQVQGIALFFKDLTRVEQLEERERLRDRLAALGEMAAAIAHEVKNPLAGIEVMAGLLRRRVTDAPDAQALLGDIISEAKLANSIVQEVLEFVRPLRLQVEPTSIAGVLRDAVQMAESTVDRRDVVVALRLDDDLPLIQADRHQLSQLFTNLLTNAFEALDGQGTVSITAVPGPCEDSHAGSDTAESEPTLLVEIADDGPGISTEIADRMFKPFFTTKPKGSGLGLAIVTKIVNAHDGRIDVNSAAGQGTRFRVTLPLSVGAHAGYTDPDPS
jgi:signal transduction histidine kinase